jgi:membrane protease YdiL (CAAX protease family)
VPWRWSDVLIGLAPFLLLRAATFLIGLRSPEFASGSRQLLMPLLLLTETWMLVVPLWIARTRTTRSVHLPRLRAVLIEGLFALLALPVVIAASNAVSLIVANVLSGTGSPTMPWAPAASSFNRIEWLAFIVMAVTLAPVAEELFYRGLLYNALRQRIHPILAAAVQAVVFGYDHPFGLANSAGIGMVGLLLALFYEWRKTLLAPILVHATMNAVGMALLTFTLAADAAAPRIGVIGEAHQAGCLVKVVMPGGAAETAGLRVGDVITAVDGESVADISGVARVVRKHRVGDLVSIEFLRGEKVHRVDVVLMRPTK